MRLTAPFALVFRSHPRTKSGVAAVAPAGEKSIRRAKRPREDCSDQKAFELTPFGRRRRRTMRPTVLLKIALLASAGCLAYALS